jgi:hypothetical protein
MKTLNSNPQFQNVPLRLDEAQTTNPEAVLDDFFQSYHLQDVRQITWQWLTEVLSSPRDSSNNPHERNNHIFFYEKLESLVEAAWVMRRGNKQQTKPASLAQPKPTGPAAGKQIKNDQPDRFTKPPRLIEKATTQPIEVINEVFDQASLADLIDYLLPNWLRVAVINTQSPYSHGTGRETLYAFYEQLIPFVSQLHVAAESQQLTEPFTFITGFFQQCSIDYLRRELADFLEAGIGHDGAYPNGFSPWQAWMAHTHIRCLVEAAYRLYTDQQTQCVFNTSFQHPVQFSVID